MFAQEVPTILPSTKLMRLDPDHARLMLGNLTASRLGSNQIAHDMWHATWHHMTWRDPSHSDDSDDSDSDISFIPPLTLTWFTGAWRLQLVSSHIGTANGEARNYCTCRAYNSLAVWRKSSRMFRWQTLQETRAWALELELHINYVIIELNWIESLSNHIIIIESWVESRWLVWVMSWVEWCSVYVTCALHVA